MSERRSRERSSFVPRVSRRKDFSKVYTHVFFFGESIMSDESDLNCFKGHILNEEIDRAKDIYSRKQEEFSRLISQQPKHVK